MRQHEPVTCLVLIVSAAIVEARETIIGDPTLPIASAVIVEARETIVGGGETLPDLDVTYIERTPRYHRYQLDYSLLPGDPFRAPRLCAGTEDDQRWPQNGETVTYTAHVKNKGSTASSQFGFLWVVNETVVDQGSSGPRARRGANV